jgi:hypothetical protein
MKSFRLLAALAPLFVSACGGGGGGGGGNFTLSRDSVAFEADQNAALPGAQVVIMTLTDNGTSFIGSGYVNVPDPGWLNVDITGGPTSFAVNLSVNNNALAEGLRTTVLTIGTADEDGDILETQDIAVSYTLGRLIDVTSAPVSGSFTYGHSTTQQAFGVTVDAGVTDTYLATANVDWIDLPASSSTGPAVLPSGIDVTGLAVGTHQGIVTVTNGADPSESDTVAVSVTITAPQLSVAQSAFSFGGASGLDLAGAALDFSVGTGTRAHPWTLTLETATGGDWLLAGSGSGDVDASGVQVGIDADRFAVNGGTYSGTVTLDVDVDGLPLSATVPVTFNKEAERLQVSADGIAFTQLPSRELLSREVGVRSTWGREGVAWSASSDQDWLTATASGETDGTLVLTADPMLLATDTLHVANVTVTSGDPLIENAPTVRVGLWIGSADPGTVVLPAGIKRTVADPVGPWLYAHSGANLVTVYNLYTGAEVTSYAAGTAQPGPLAISSDGLTLFVGEEATGKAYALATADGTLAQTFTPPLPTTNYHLAYARTDALPTLYFGNTYVADAQSGEYLDGFLAAGGKLAASGDGRIVYAYDLGISPATATRQDLRRVALGDGSVLVVGTQAIGAGSNGADVAIAQDGARFYAASGGYYAFPAYDGVTSQFIQDLSGAAYPNNAEVAWNGVFAGGAGAYYDAVDVWFYDPAGGALGTARCFGSNSNWMVMDSIRFSGDGLRWACSASTDVWGEGAVVRIRDVPGS